MSRRFDVVVVGAGPAGALAAGELARSGRRVLLVDRAAFPRAKVCGGCVSPAALAELEAVGLGGVVAARGGLQLDRFALHAGGRTATLPLPGGRALSRSVLDDALARAAAARGATFRDRTAARLVAPGELILDERETVRTDLVLAADGLGGRLLERSRRVARRSLLGAGAVFENAPAFVEPGAIHMASARGGYVGVVRVEGSGAVAAAALAPRFVNARGGIAPAVASILREAGLPALPAGAWRGTPRLTRQPARPWAERVLALGDASGYVEPFTGEGIAWALAAARAVVPVARPGWRPDTGPAWARVHRRLLRRRQRRCRALVTFLRAPWLVRCAVLVLARAPRLARPLVAAATLGETR